METVGMDTIVIVLLIIIGLWLLSKAIKIVPEYQRLVVLRFGKSVGIRGPGLVLLIPFVDKPIWTDLREMVIDVPSQTCITKDNAPVAIDFLIYMKIVDPEMSVIQVQNFRAASQGIATTTLRAVVGDIVLDDVLSKREHINETLRQKLDEVTGRWGVKVTAVEIREILPPREIQEAMSRQMSAERDRRALVTEATGKREAAITVADGEKQAAILKAEGARQATILQAEGERQATILQAEGYALALQKVFEVAQMLDSKTMSLQYLEALKSIGASPATKFIFPMELLNLVKPFVGHTNKAAE